MSVVFDAVSDLWVQALCCMVQCVAIGSCAVPHLDRCSGPFLSFFVVRILSVPACAEHARASASVPPLLELLGVELVWCCLGPLLGFPFFGFVSVLFFIVVLVAFRSCCFMHVL